MEMREKIARISEKLGKQVNIAIQQGEPREFLTPVGEDEVLIHVQVNLPVEQLQAGAADEVGWEYAYWRVFNRPSWEDDPLEVQAQAILAHWRDQKHFVPDRSSKHAIKHALGLLEEVVTNPHCPEAKMWLDHAKSLIMAWLISSGAGA